VWLLDLRAFDPETLETPHRIPGKRRIRAVAVGDMRQKWPFLGRRVGNFEFSRGKRPGGKGWA